jgi:uncharacterized membrane protein YhaH (DUF805 family)
MFKAPFSFEGRIRRKEYALTALILYVIALILGITIDEGVEGVFLLAYLIVLFAVGWMHLAQTAKRCHDVNTSGWFQLIPFYTLYLFFADGDKTRNKYGPSPKYKDYEDFGSK